MCSLQLVVPTSPTVSLSSSALALLGCFQSLTLGYDPFLPLARFSLLISPPQFQLQHHFLGKAYPDLHDHVTPTLPSVSHPPTPPPPPPVLDHPVLFFSSIGKNWRWPFVMMYLLVWEFDFLPVASHLAPHCVSALGTVVINRCLENMVERGHSGTMSYT